LLEARVYVIGFLCPRMFGRYLNALKNIELVFPHYPILFRDKFLGNIAAFFAG
jgi:hypothetical protein